MISAQEIMELFSITSIEPRSISGKPGSQNQQKQTMKKIKMKPSGLELSATLMRCLYAVCLCLMGCGTTDNSEMTVVLDNDNCLPVSQPPGDDLKNTRINVFVETSGSMSGFMSAKGTDFQKELWSVVEGLQSRIKGGIDLFQVRSKSEPIAGLQVSDFRQRLNTGGFQSSKSTDIPEMLDSIFKKADDHTVSVLVSDLIFSPENGNLAQISQISTDIRQRFKGKNRSSVLLQLSSDFYHKNHKGKIENSPYYIWIIGETKAVKAVSKVIGGLIETPANEIDFGILLPRPRYSVLPSLSQVTNAIPLACPQDGGYYVYRDYSEEDQPELKFWLGVDLSALPAYMRTADYLSKHLSLGTLSADASVLQVKDISELKTKVDRELASKLGLTQMLQLRVGQISEGTIISLNLERHAPAWIDQFNIDKEDGLRQQTFGLKKMINGLEDAPQDKQVSVFAESFKIYITKK